MLSDRHRDGADSVPAISVKVKIDPKVELSLDMMVMVTNAECRAVEAFQQAEP